MVVVVSLEKKTFDCLSFLSPTLSLSYSLLVLLLNFCIFLFTSFARMFERFECLNADGVREEIETMFKVSSCTSRNRKLFL